MIKLPALLCWFYFIVEKVGYAPTPVDFQSTASTKLASSPIVRVDGLEPPNSMRADLQSAAIATMRYPPIVEDIGFEPMTLWM